MPADPDPPFDPDRILATLDAHGVEYLLVGGLAARAHGAQRRTADVDCVPNSGGRNTYPRTLGRAVRYKVGGLTVAVASLDDITESKEHAGREKDRDGLLGLHGLRSRRRNP